MSQNYIEITLPELYPVVMGVAGTLSFLCLLVGFGAGRKRATIFDH